MRKKRVMMLGAWLLTAVARAQEPTMAEEVKALKARVQQLEELVARQAEALEKLGVREETETLPLAYANAKPAKAAESESAQLKGGADKSQIAKIDEAELKEKVKGWIEEHTGGLKLSGFFALNAASRYQNRAEQQPKFSLDPLEVHLEYPYGEHFAISTALAWSGGQAGIGTALIDYHWFEDRVPPRGRIFLQPAFHVQGGRFDIPFGIDYQYFAPVDRVTATVPITTYRIQQGGGERSQQGGYNGDGVRFYGSWKMLDFTGYWVDSVYDSGGTSAGGRLAVSLGYNPYRLHRHDSPRTLNLGASILADYDDRGELAHLVYGGDLTLASRYGELLGEVMYKDMRLAEDLDELAWHLTLIINAKPWLHPYLRYGRWRPEYAWIESDEEVYRVASVNEFAAGLHWLINEYLAFKGEYLTHLGGRTQEPGFQHSLGLAQLVVNF